MTLNFQLTFSDYDEALQLHARSPTNAPPSIWERYQFLFLTIAIAVGWVALFFFEAAWFALNAGRASPDSVSVKTFPAVFGSLPLLLIYSLIWPLFCKMFDPSLRRSLRNLYLLCIVLSLITSVATTLLQPPAPDTPPDPGAGSTALLAWLPWIVMCVCYFLIFRRFLIVSRRQGWDRQQNLHGTQIVTVSDSEMRFQSELSQQTYFWSAFQKYREGASVFMIYVSDASFQLVPKRAFEAGGEVERFRELLNIKVGSLQPQGFSPLPAKQSVVPPLLPGK